MNIEIILTAIFVVLAGFGVYMNYYTATQSYSAELLVKYTRMSRRWWAVALSYGLAATPALWGWDVMAVVGIALTTVGYALGYHQEAAARATIANS